MSRRTNGLRTSILRQQREDKRATGPLCLRFPLNLPLRSGKVHRGGSQIQRAISDNFVILLLESKGNHPYMSIICYFTSSPRELTVPTMVPLCFAHMFYCPFIISIIPINALWIISISTSPTPGECGALLSGGQRRTRGCREGGGVVVVFVCLMIN